MFRISLRELLCVIGLAAVAIVSVRYASATWLLLVQCASLLAMFTAIVFAAGQRGAKQAFAVAFLLMGACYYALVVSWPNDADTDNRENQTDELDVFHGQLPTTRLLRAVFWASRRNAWINTSTGEELPNFDRNQPSLPLEGDRRTSGIDKLGRAIYTPPPPYAGMREFPPRYEFMLIGQLWWAMLFGYLAGRLASFVYMRESDETAG